MSLPIKLTCRANKVNTDGTCSIFVQYCCDEKHKPLFGTDVKIPSRFWDRKDRCINGRLPSEFGNYKELNDELQKLKKVVEDIVTYARLKKIPNQDRAEFAKKHFSPTFDINAIEAQEKAAAKEKEVEEKNRLSLYNQFDEYIKSKTRKVSKATLTV